MNMRRILAALLAVAAAAGLSACGEGAPEPAPTVPQAPQTEPTSAQPDPTDPAEPEISIQTYTLEVMNSAMEGEAELSLADDGTFTLISGYDVTLYAYELEAVGIDGEDLSYRFQTKMTGSWELVDGKHICSSEQYFGTVIAEEAQFPVLEAYVEAVYEDQAIIDAHRRMLYDGEYMPYDEIDGHCYDLKMILAPTENGYQVEQTLEYYEDGRLGFSYDHTNGKISTVTSYYAFGGVFYTHYYENGKLHHTDYYDVDGNLTDTSYPDENGEY